MPRTEKSAVPGGDRRRILRDRLTEAGLRKRRRWLSVREEILGGVRSPAARLRAVLDGTGPLFSALGDYLSLRADLLPLADCYELGRNGTVPDATPPELIRTILHRELPEAPKDLVDDFDRPARHDTLFQSHRGRLPDGTPVSVKILRPEFEDGARRDDELLPVLEKARVLAEDGTELALPSAVAEFRHFLRERMDLGREAAALGEIRDAPNHFSTFEVPRVLPALCSGRVLTTEAVGSGRCLASASHPAPQQTGSPGRQGQPVESGAEIDGDVARRLALFWFQQALLGPVYPEGSLDDLVVLPDDRIGLTGGLFGRLEHETRVDLFRYLTAVARNDPDWACDLLLDHCVPVGREVSRTEMLRRFRQAEPFRSGGWSDFYRGQRFADTLFIQWRLARQGGYRPAPYLLPFFRGLFSLERHARHIAPDRDGLRQGFDDARVIAAAVRVREFMSPDAFRDNVENLVETAAVIGRELRVSTRTTSRGRVWDGTGNRRMHRGDQRDTRTTVLGIVLVLASALLIAERVLSPGSGGPTGQNLGTVALAGVAVAVLWYAGRNGKG